jgi:hypothetical protein
MNKGVEIYKKLPYDLQYYINKLIHKSYMKDLSKEIFDNKTNLQRYMEIHDPADIIELAWHRGVILYFYERRTNTIASFIDQINLVLLNHFYEE